MAQPAAYDFTPQGAGAGLLVFALGYVCGFGFATVMVLRDLGVAAPGVLPALAQQALLVALYLAGGGLILLYLVFGAYRFRFDDASFRVFTWRGWQAYTWAQIRRADLNTYKSSIELALVAGPRQVISLPLTSFRRSASLLAFVRARVPVPIAATPAQLALITDD
jgi:hypothetical protein